MADWYYKKWNKDIGPVNREEILSAIQGGVIGKRSLVSRDGKNWKTLDVAGFYSGDEQKQGKESVQDKVPFSLDEIIEAFKSRFHKLDNLVRKIRFATRPKPGTMELCENSSGERLCGFCAEVIKADAIKCKHCGEFVSPNGIPANTGLRNVGVFLFILGAVWVSLAFNMDTTVLVEGKTYGEGAFAFTSPSQRVNNLGLMNDRQNHLMIAGIVLLAGIVLIGFGSKQSRK